LTSTNCVVMKSPPTRTLASQDEVELVGLEAADDVEEEVGEPPPTKTLRHLTQSPPP
jgi:hypothetical protein